MDIPLQIELKYGKSKVSFFLNGKCRCETLQPNTPSIKLDEKEILKIRMRNPLASPPLEEVLRPDDRILIVVPDKTRVAKLDVIFPFLFGIFQNKKIDDSQVTVIFASGSHGPMSEEEKRAILGEAAYHRFKVVQHDPRSPIVEKLGTTGRGTPVMVNPIISKHDKIIVIGSVVHHYFAGFGGGPKMIIPGLAALETIWHNHRLAVQSEDSPLHPACEPGNLENNPVYEDIMEAAKMVEVHFAIQLVLDENNQITDAFCGDLFSSFQKASLRVQHLNTVEIEELADVVIASAGGYPKDLNLIQAHKALHYASRALRPGGTLLLFAECSEGWGNPDILKWFEFSDYGEMKKQVMENFELNANTALVLKYKLERYRVLLVSTLPHDPLRKMGFYPFPSAEPAVETVRHKIKEGSLVYVIPNASVTLPVLK